MRRTSLALIWLGLVPTVRVGAADSLSPELVNHVKNATVFVKVEFKSPGKDARLSGSGSGFVIQVDGKHEYIVTNHHVIAPPVRNTNLAACWGVFSSGSKNAKTVPLEVLGSDPVRDLAVLRCKDDIRFPAPISLGRQEEPTELLDVYQFGFPFGAALQRSRENPAVSVNKGSVSSIRRDRFDEINAIQLDVEINPGNSGGPVVDAQGRLVGVAVSKIVRTRIGFVIPLHAVKTFLNGVLGPVRFKTTKVAGSAAEVRVDAVLVDPFNKIKGASVSYLPEETLKEKPSQSANGWSPLVGAMRSELRIDRKAAAAMLNINSPKRSALRFVAQFSWVNGEGKTFFSAPIKFTVDTHRNLGLPEQVNRSAVVRKWKSGDAQFAELGIYFEQGKGAFPNCLCWDTEGNAFFYLDQAGVLHRVERKGLIESLRLDVGCKCSWLSASAEGLVLTLPAYQEIWVLDPTTLATKKKLSVPSTNTTDWVLTRAVSSPSLSIGIVVEWDKITMLDFRSGECGKAYTWAAMKNPLEFMMPAVTDDGRYLFTWGPTHNKLHRFRIEGKELRYEESSQRLIEVAGTNGQICISPDSKYVCLPNSAGNSRTLKGLPKINLYGLYVFPVADINKPAFVIDDAAGQSCAVGFDSKAGLIYGHDLSHALVVFDAHGKRIKEYRLNVPDSISVSQYLVHPQGRSLLIFNQFNLYYVELSGN